MNSGCAWRYFCEWRNLSFSQKYNNLFYSAIWTVFTEEKNKLIMTGAS